MRAKDVIIAEGAVLNKLVDKQTRALEAAVELEHSLGSQLVRSIAILSFSFAFKTINDLNGV
jgi:hypothetical protein